MKSLFIIASALMATTASASTLVCQTQPSPTRGSRYAVAITPDQNTVDEANAHVTFNGGMAHFIMIVGDYPVSIRHLGPEMAIFSSVDKDFELTVNYQRFGDDQYYRGNLTIHSNDRDLNAPVKCR